MMPPIVGDSSGTRATPPCFRTGWPAPVSLRGRRAPDANRHGLAGEEGAGDSRVDRVAAAVHAAPPDHLGMTGVAEESAVLVAGGVRRPRRDRQHGESQGEGQSEGDDELAREGLLLGHAESPWGSERKQDCFDSVY